MPMLSSCLPHWLFLRFQLLTVCVCVCGCIKCLDVCAYYNNNTTNNDDGCLLCSWWCFRMWSHHRNSVGIEHELGNENTTALFWATYVHSLTHGKLNYSSVIICLNFLTSFLLFSVLLPLLLSRLFKWKRQFSVFGGVHFTFDAVVLNAVCSWVWASVDVCLPVCVCVFLSFSLLHQRFYFPSIGISMSHACRQFANCCSKHVNSLGACLLIHPTFYIYINRKKIYAKPMSLRKKLKRVEKKRKVGECTSSSHTHTHTD